jgi:hypothetical protein
MLHTVGLDGTLGACSKVWTLAESKGLHEGC